MRIPRKYLYPFLTAIMFPIVLTGTMWAFDLMSDEQWLRGDKVEVSSDKAVAIARTECFSTMPNQRVDARPKTYLKGDAWFVSIDRNAGIWQWPGGFTVAQAEVNAHNGIVTDCRLFAWDGSGM